MTKRRIFIAIPLPADLKKALGDLPQKWPDIPCRWIKPENLHLTIIPPIYLTDDELTRMSKTIGESIADFPAFELGFEKIIYGPPGKPSRMIWLWGKPNEKLVTLQQTVSQAILETGIPYRQESRPLTPHITLCRMNEHEWRRFEPKPKIDEPFLHILTVDTLNIMESNLQRSGAEYTVLEPIPLGV